MNAIYLDYNASTPIDPAVAAAMRPFLAEAYGNPSSGHWASVPAKAVRGAVYYPPVGWLARALAPIDSSLGSLTTFGAAFIALGAISPDRR